MVHLSQTFELQGSEEEPVTAREQHFCQECADSYFACTPEMNASRHLICLSDWYRSRLYDMLEKVHPEAFDNSDSEACDRACELMRKFLREQLTKDGIELNEDGFEMLCQDFFGSYHFYNRVNEHNRKKL
jgi:hypothetical protein